MNSGAPLEIKAEGFPLASSEERTQLTDRSGNIQTERSGNIEQPSTQVSVVNTARSAAAAGDDMGTRAQDGGDTSIRLDLETEDGKKQEIYIDDKGGYCILAIN